MSVTEHVRWTDDEVNPADRLAVRFDGFGLEIAEEAMPFRGAMRCNPRRRKVLFLTRAEAAWLRDTIAKLDVGDGT